MSAAGLKVNVLPFDVGVAVALVVGAANVVGVDVRVRVDVTVGVFVKMSCDVAVNVGEASGAIVGVWDIGMVGVGDGELVGVMIGADNVMTNCGAKPAAPSFEE